MIFLIHILTCSPAILLEASAPLSECPDRQKCPSAQSSLDALCAICYSVPFLYTSTIPLHSDKVGCSRHDGRALEHRSVCVILHLGGVRRGSQISWADLWFSRRIDGVAELGGGVRASSRGHADFDYDCVGIIAISQRWQWFCMGVMWVVADSAETHERNEKIFVVILVALSFPRSSSDVVVIAGYFPHIPGGLHKADAAEPSPDQLRAVATTASTASTMHCT
jgi:hypothetical protein